jgi:hypothetical protein
MHENNLHHRYNVYKGDNLETLKKVALPIELTLEVT